MDERRYSSWMLERIVIGDRVRLRLGVSTLGRHSSSTIRILESGLASRHHAEIEVSNDGQTVTIKDLNSSNGIFINETMYKSATINITAEDEIGFGVSSNLMPGEDETKYPIYILRYLPMRRNRQPRQPPTQPVTQDILPTQQIYKPEEKENENKKDEAPSCSKDANRKQPEDDVKPSGSKDAKRKQSEEDDKPSCSKDANRKPSEGDDKPSCSKDANRKQSEVDNKDVNKPTKPPITMSDEIVEISDDDEDDNDANKNVGRSDENPKEILENMPQIDINIKKEKLDNKESTKATTSVKINENCNLNKEESSNLNDKNLIEITELNKKDTPTTSNTSANKEENITKDIEKDYITNIENIIKVTAIKDTSKTTNLNNEDIGKINNLNKVENITKDIVAKDSNLKDKNVIEIEDAKDASKTSNINKEKISETVKTSIENSEVIDISDNEIISKTTNLNKEDIAKTPIENSQKIDVTSNELISKTTNLNKDETAKTSIENAQRIDVISNDLISLTTNLNKEKVNTIPEDINKIPNLSDDNILSIDDPDYINPSQVCKNSNQINPAELSEENKEPIQDKLKGISNNIHTPLLSSMKKEHIRHASVNIQNIFGLDNDEDDDVVQNSLKEINPLVYNEMLGKPLTATPNLENSLHNGDVITLTDDEEVEELGTIMSIPQEKPATNTNIDMPKSPSIFDTSLNDSNENADIDPVVKEETSNMSTNLKDNINLDDYFSNTISDDEEMLFSQVLINDMKAELQDNIGNEPNLPLPDVHDYDNLPPMFDDHDDVDIQIKKEPGIEEVLSQIPHELKNSSWAISDDEDYDEELETKWSAKIFSQSFSLTQNMSQVYDLNLDDEDDEDEEDEDDLNLLDDDIENIANLYNSNCEKISELPNDNDINDIFLDLERQSKSLEEDLKAGKAKTDISDGKEKSKNEIIEPEKDTEIINSIEKTRERSPEITNDNTNMTESPIIRRRSLSKTKPINDSSSSDDEQEMEKDHQDVREQKNKENLKKSPIVEEPFITNINDNKDSGNKEKPLTTTTSRLLPPIIDAPSLPKHKGKLRGVSAEPKSHNTTPSSSSNTLSSTKDKLKHDYYSKDLKRKWLEKPSISKKRDKERKKLIKECRKDKLKELAEKRKSPTKENIKRKHSTDSDHPAEHKMKKPKVKVTTHNRGTFLAEPKLPSPDEAATSAGNKSDLNQFKIPKVINKKSDPSTNRNGSLPPHVNGLRRANSLDGLDTFSQQINKPDELLLKRQNSDPNKKQEHRSTISSHNSHPPLRRLSTTDINKSSMPTATTSTPHAVLKPANLCPSSPICKEAIAARAVRTTNKITFASMEKNIIESIENTRKLTKLSTDPPTPAAGLSSNMKKSSSSAIKKTVRFNDTPVIYYIERISGACKKVVNKDVLPMSTNRDRRYLTRQTYPIIDCSDKIVSNLLSWSNEWLIKRNAAAAAASDIVFPMPQYFSSFEHYKSIIFPLMKLEFVSLLEREYNTTFKVKNFKVALEYVTHNKDRFMLVTKFNNQNREEVNSSSYDLVLLETDKRGGPQIFAHLTHNRKGTGSSSTIVYEIIAKNFTKEYLSSIKEFKVRPVMDKVRVHFGSFNAVYQLEATPLFHRIMNPLELLKCKPPPKKKIIYRGCDPLNDKQKQVLLHTYTKIIDEATPNITLLQGPPGTGKSCVIANLALQTLYGDEVRYLDKKILICAQSNAAVDVIAGKLYGISLKMRAEIRFRLIRYGMLNKIDPGVAPIALQNLVEHDQMKKMQGKNNDQQLENKEHLKNQISQLELQITDLKSRNIRGTVDEDTLVEKQRQLKQLHNIMNQNMRPEDERSLYSWYLTNANIICATLSSCVNLLQYVNYFDICIIDEATQCTEPWTLLPLKFGINSLVLVGDTQQLPATVLSKKANELGLGTSLFTRIQQCLENTTITKGNGSVTTPTNIICGLQTQYRMNPEICKFPNLYFYRNELINGKITAEYKSPIMPFSILNLAYTQNTTTESGKITNNLEAEFVAKLLKALDGFIPNKYNSYGVITPYAHHRTTLELSIRSLGLTNIMVNTIDSYQGLEKDVIIISNARTSGIGFLANPQRLNVALTRPKKCLILCGNFKNLEVVPAWRCLLENARERKLYHEISTNCVSDIQKNVIDKIRIKKNC